MEAAAPGDSGVRVETGAMSNRLNVSIERTEAQKTDNNRNLVPKSRTASFYLTLCVIQRRQRDRSTVPLLSFQDMVSYFGVKPKGGDKEVAPGYVFMLWYEFSGDFKNAWVRQSKTISKER